MSQGSNPIIRADTPPGSLVFTHQVFGQTERRTDNGQREVGMDSVCAVAA